MFTADPYSCKSLFLSIVEMYLLLDFSTHKDHFEITDINLSVILEVQHSKIQQFKVWVFDLENYNL
jgi:hypothetical protein